MNVLDPILTESEAAEYLRMSVHTLREWRRFKKGPQWLRLGERRPGYRSSDLITWLEGQVAA